jgi:hypothetical protein
MRSVQRRFISLFFGAVLFAAIPSLRAQQTSGDFRWIDFHAPEDQNIVAWVTRSLTVEKWTAIREIGVVYDAALVVTADRATPQSPPNADAFTVWNVSLTSHVAAPLLHGVNLRWFDWQRFADGAPLELTALYDNCANCASSTYFAAFHYDIAHHMWTVRWLHGGQGILVWNAATSGAPGVTWTQVYAVMAGPGGNAQIATWNHFDYGAQKPPSDTVFRFDIDPMTGQERTAELTKADPKLMEQAKAMEMRLCRGQDAVEGLARGQDSPLCQQLLGAQPQRKPVTTPPANNRGRAIPPAARH